MVLIWQSVAQVRFENVEKYFGDTCILHDFNLQVKEGEFCVLVGPSGCGKSTTLRLLAGLEEITRGNIYIGDRLINRVPPKDRNIAMVFQDYALYPHLKVYDNMAFGLKVRKYPKEEIKERVGWASKLLGLDKYLDRKPSDLSGGQRQRVAIGRALVRRPDVFLFDEPLSNLDAKLRSQMRVEILRLHQKIGVTVLYVTHDQVEAMTMADKIVVLNNGFIQQIGSPTELYDKPQNKFVAGFIGSPPMNFYDAQIEKVGSKLLVAANGHKFEVEGKPNLEKYISQDVSWGIRPEDLYDSMFDPIKTNVNKYNLTADIVEELGKEKEIHYNFGGKDLLAIHSYKSDIKAGQNVSVVFDMSKAHFFNKEGERI